LPGFCTKINHGFFFTLLDKVLVALKFDLTHHVQIINSKNMAPFLSGLNSENMANWADIWNLLNP